MFKKLFLIVIFSLLAKVSLAEDMISSEGSEISPLQVNIKKLLGNQPDDDTPIIFNSEEGPLIANLSEGANEYLVIHASEEAPVMFDSLNVSMKKLLDINQTSPLDSEEPPLLVNSSEDHIILISEDPPSKYGPEGPVIILEAGPEIIWN